MSETWNNRTKLVHGGTRRSQYNEVSEAIFLTQGFVYDSAEQAEARFLETGPDEFIYARYGNPTVAMFEERIALLEGAEDAFATASGMAAVNGALTSILKAGDHVVSAQALFGSCLYILENILARQCRCCRAPCHTCQCCPCCRGSSPAKIPICCDAEFFL